LDWGDFGLEAICASLTMSSATIGRAAYNLAASRLDFSV